VLIVDGVGEERCALSHILEAQGVRVLSVPSGEEALAVVRDTAVDLVLLDAALDDEDALLLYGPLRELKSAAPPVIVICHREDTDALTAAFEAGAVDAIARPIQRSEVTARVATHLKLLALARELSQRERQLAEREPARARGSSGAGNTLKLSEVKEQLISDALAQTNGNVTQAAKLLGVHRSWLYRRK
jgi:DNA-binding NtrC family response regulator